MQCRGSNGAANPRRTSVSWLRPAFVQEASPTAHSFRMMEKGGQHYLQKENIVKGYILKRDAEPFNSR